jgi:hypothetical protein
LERRVQALEAGAVSGSLRTRIQKLELRQPLATRAFLICAGTPDQIPAALVAAEAKGEVTTVTSGVCRNPLDTGARQPVVYEQVAGAWLAADPQVLVA